MKSPAFPVARLLLAAVCACICWSSAPAQERIVPADAMSYRSNAVCEIGTGTWCGWCVRGIAACDYYMAAFPGTEQSGRFIPISVHVADQLSQTEYGLGLGIANYPGMRVNRVGGVVDPKSMDRVSSIIRNGSHWLAEIGRIEAGAAELSVDFSVRCGYDADDIPVNYAIVLTENGLGPYLQANNYNNATVFDRKELPIWLEPYVEPFYSAGSRVEMRYDYVAKGIWPSYEGAPLGSSSWSRNVPQTFTASVPVTAALNLDSCSIVVLAIDQASGQIVASDVKAVNSRQSGVPTISAERPYALVGRILEIGAGAKSAALCMADGTLVYSGGPARIELEPAKLYILVVDGQAYKIAAH